MINVDQKNDFSGSSKGKHVEIIETSGNKVYKEIEKFR